MASLATFTRAFGMSDEVWRRHANPWSVWTRFAAIPALIAAIWSRSILGWWALLPVGMVMIWLWLNPRVFAPVAPTSWAAKGIYGERLWVEDRSRIPPADLAALGWLVVPGLAGAALLAWGLIQLRVWPTFLGALLVVVAQLWRIDRLGRAYDAVNEPPGPHRDLAI